MLWVNDAMSKWRCVQIEALFDTLPLLPFSLLCTNHFYILFALAPLRLRSSTAFAFLSTMTVVLRCPAWCEVVHDPFRQTSSQPSPSGKRRKRGRTAEANTVNYVSQSSSPPDHITVIHYQPQPCPPSPTKRKPTC